MFDRMCYLDTEQYSLHSIVHFFFEMGDHNYAKQVQVKEDDNAASESSLCLLQNSSGEQSTADYPVDEEAGSIAVSASSRNDDVNVERIKKFIANGFIIDSVSMLCPKCKEVFELKEVEGHEIGCKGPKKKENEKNKKKKIETQSNTQDKTQGDTRDESQGDTQDESQSDTQDESQSDTQEEIQSDTESETKKKERRQKHAQVEQRKRDITKEHFDELRLILHNWLIKEEKRHKNDVLRIAIERLKEHYPTNLDVPRKTLTEALNKARQVTQRKDNPSAKNNSSSSDDNDE